MSNENKNLKEDNGLIFGHNPCQTGDAKWMCLEDIYQKFHRPNAYDIGGTNIEDVADYWFMYITKQVENIFLLELFICSRQEGLFNVAVSGSSELTFKRKSDIVYLDTTLKDYQLKKESNLAFNYVTTYNFTDLDVDLLKDKKLYIAVSFHSPLKSDLDQDFIDSIKCRHDFDALLIDPIDADFTIESSDGDKFQVHKVILACQSEVFKAMLKDETAESQNNYVKLIDVCKEDLQCLIEFMYTGTVKELEDSNCINLLILADKYDLKGLKDLAQYELSLQLSTDNVLEILVLADMYNSDSLKFSALKFIKKNVTVLGNSMFDEINNAELVRELCRYLVT
ncbi:unnamed protein product [Parnassius apollo]|uniref:(apollo) hypothetical protein n=1 Tax=Parnassius apollo TaxID=110799 RepID=A0A8S3XSC7_PARAO|nr:unnamed protein product [Parnassius apollo]